MSTQILTTNYDVKNIIMRKKALLNKLLQVIYAISRKKSPHLDDFKNIENIKKVIVSILNKCNSDEEVYFRHNFKELIGKGIESKLVSANDFDGFTTYQLLLKLSSDCTKNTVITNLLEKSFKEQMLKVLEICQKLRDNVGLSLDEKSIMNYLSHGLTNFDHIEHVHDTGLDPKSDDILAVIILHGVCKWANQHNNNISLNFNSVAVSRKTRNARAVAVRLVIDDDSAWITHNSVITQNDNYSFPITEGESVLVGCSKHTSSGSITSKSITIREKSLFFITGFMNVDDLPTEYPSDFTWASQGSHKFSFNIGEILGRKGNSVLEKLKTIEEPIYQDDRMVTFTRTEWNNLYRLFQKEELLKSITTLAAVEFLLTVSAETVKENDGKLTDAFMRSFNIPYENWSSIYESFN